jgi:hypothetical protein
VGNLVLEPEVKSGDAELVVLSNREQRTFDGRTSEYGSYISMFAMDAYRELGLSVEVMSGQRHWHSKTTANS